MDNTYDFFDRVRERMARSPEFRKALMAELAEEGLTLPELKPNAFVLEYGTNRILWEGYVSSAEREAWFDKYPEGIAGNRVWYKVSRPETEKGHRAEE